MDINAAAKEYGNGIITSFKKNRRMLLMMLQFAAGMNIWCRFCEKVGRLSFRRFFRYVFGIYKLQRHTITRSEFYKFTGRQRRIYARCICIRTVRGRAAAYMCSARNKRRGYRNAVGVFILEFRSARTRLLRFGDISRAYTGCFCTAARLQRRNKLVI